MESFEVESLPNAHNKKIMLVGPRPLVLHKWYDPNQYWFPFMNGTVFMVRAEEPTPRYKRVPETKISRKTYARMSPEGIKPYIYEKGVHQHVLPFVEFKRVSNKQFKELTAAEWPTWDCDPATTRPYSLHIADNPPFDPTPWCMENLTGRFFCNNKVIYCERQIDALLAKLVFS